MNLLLTLLLTAAPAPPASFSDAELAERAEAAFREGRRLRDDPDQARPHFQQAAESYEELRRRGTSNPDLYRNQGNAYLLASDLPRAILAYRRGLRLAPDDSTLRSNLAYAREQVVYPSASTLGRPPADAWPSWLMRWVWWTATGLAVLSYSLGWLSLTRWLMTRRGRLLLASGVAFIIALLAAIVPAAGWGIQEWQTQRETHHPLVVIAEDDVLLRKGNGFSYPSSYDCPLNRGVEARLLHARGNWLQIELAGGEIGWLSRNTALLDSPQGASRTGIE